MKIVTIGQVREHVKADGDDDELLTAYANAAEAACERLANRAIFATTGELTTAKAAVPAMMTTAYETYDAAVLAAQGHDDDRIIVMMTAQAQNALNAATLRADWVLNGLAIDKAADGTSQPKGDDIVVAILMTAGHYYRNRENVVTGQGAAAVELPGAAKDIMLLNRWIGRNEY